jgi:hypothetical protein
VDSLEPVARQPLDPAWRRARVHEKCQRLAQRSFDGLLMLHVRTAGNPAALSADVRQAIAAIDKRVTVFGMKTMGQQISDQLILERLLATLAGGFARLRSLSLPWDSMV